MIGKRVLAMLVAAGLALSCNDSSGPGGDTASATDPSGDVFGADSIKPDLTRVTVTHDGGGLLIVMEFTANPIPIFKDSIYGTGGIVDLDVDQDSTTGSQTWADFYRPSGSSGMGEEYYLQFLSYGADSTVSVNTDAGAPTGSVRPVFNGKQVSLRIPLTMIGNDDGSVNVAVLVGSKLAPSDVAPNAGHIKVGGT